MLLTCDIAFSHFGWVAVDLGKPVACGVIETEKTKRKGILVSDDYYHRSTKLITELHKVVQTFAVQGILGELPSGGAKSSRAAIQMNMSTGIVAALTYFTKLPAEFCTPNDVKLATVGTRAATKPEIMDFVIDFFKGKKTKKLVNCKKSKNNPDGKRAEYIYHFLGQKFGSTRFEHIADALGAYIYLKDSGNLARIF